MSTTIIELKLADLTQGWSWQRDINWIYADTTSAEWLIVAPASCKRWVCHQASLANFGSINMRGISATGNGQTGNLATSSWTVTPLQLVPGNVLIPNFGETPTNAKGQAASPAGAMPGAVSPDGSSFSISWLPVSTKGV